MDAERNIGHEKCFHVPGIGVSLEICTLEFINGSEIAGTYCFNIHRLYIE